MIINLRILLSSSFWPSKKDNTSLVKLGWENVIQNVEEKFKELKVQEYRKENGLSTLDMYTEDLNEDLPQTYYTETELNEIETM